MGHKCLAQTFILVNFSGAEKYINMKRRKAEKQKTQTS